MQESNQEKKVVTMQQQLEELVQGIRDEGEIDLKETPVLFKWVYPEDKTILYQLMIEEVNADDVEYIEDEGDEVEGEIITDKIVLH